MKTFLTLFSLFLFTTIFSQSDFFKDKKLDLEVGVNFNNLNTLELGLNLTKDMDQNMVTDAIILSSEFNSSFKNHFLYAPKLTYSYYFFIFNASLSVTNYNYGNNSTFYTNPQIGISLFGLADIVDGYNIPLADKNHDFQGSMLTLRCRVMGINNFFKN
jgi:hypothetical protein